MHAAPVKGKVVAVCCNPEPGLPKPIVDAVHLIENWGIEGDYHAGSLVRHRLLKAVVKKQPGQTIFKAGMMTRILQSGWVRAGDIVEVLSTIGVS